MKPRYRSRNVHHVTEPFKFANNSLKKEGRRLALRSHASLSEGWTFISETNGGVKKRTVEQGTGDAASQGKEVEIEYTGKIAPDEWSPEDVIECWLNEQQGVTALAPAFLQLAIDGSKLTDEDFFTAEMIADELGVGNKIQCKKLVMAARRLSKDKADHPTGTEFDSSAERGPFRFTLGKGKAIRAMELAVMGMKVGEVAEVICRADYAYGKDGLRKSSGEVVVPPFATLQFEIKLLSAE